MPEPIDMRTRGPRIMILAPGRTLHVEPMPPTNVVDGAEELRDVPVVYHFDGFCVLATTEGCVLVLPTNLRDVIKAAEPGQDRLITQWSKVGTLEQVDEDVYQRLRAMSLEWLPKESVP
jgi:hypothetical protein